MAESEVSKPLATLTACGWLGVRAAGGRCPHHGDDKCLVTFFAPSHWPDQYILLHGDYVNAPVGPFPSETAAHLHYQRNQPHSKKHPYLSKPKILRLLRPFQWDTTGNVAIDTDDSRPIGANENSEL